MVSNTSVLDKARLCALNPVCGSEHPSTGLILDRGPKDLISSCRNLLQRYALPLFRFPAQADANAPQRQRRRHLGVLAQMQAAKTQSDHCGMQPAAARFSVPIPPAATVWYIISSPIHYRPRPRSIFVNIPTLLACSTTSSYSPDAEVGSAFRYRQVSAPIVPLRRRAALRQHLFWLTVAWSS